MARIRWLKCTMSPDEIFIDGTSQNTWRVHPLPNAFKRASRSHFTRYMRFQTHLDVNIRSISVKMVLTRARSSPWCSTCHFRRWCRGASYRQRGSVIIRIKLKRNPSTWDPRVLRGRIHSKLALTRMRLLPGSSPKPMIRVNMALNIKKCWACAENGLENIWLFDQIFQKICKTSSWPHPLLASCF